MFVSSYNTYIQANTSNNSAKQKIENSENLSKAFSTKLFHNDIVKNLTSVPVDYISKKELSNTKQELDYQKQQLGKPLDETQKAIKQSISKFTMSNSLLNANNAYTDSAKMFSQLKVPQAPINKTQSIDQTLPREPRKIKELNMRHKMVNTYIANDNYYKVTA